MPKFWEIKQSATPKTLDLYIYTRIAADGYDFWTGEKIKSETSANTLREKIEGYGDIDSINIYINSLGGSCMEGHAIYNVLKRCKAHKTVYVDGFCCSVASVIAMAGDKIVMPRNTVMMIHNPWESCSGNATELRKAADDLEKMGEAFNSVYLERSGGKITAEELKAMLDAETTLTAEECISYGFADELADYNADLEAAKAQIEQAARSQPKQYAEALRSIAAKLDKVPEPKPQPKQEPEPKEPAEPQQKQDFAEAAKSLFEKYFKTKGEKDA